MSRTQTPCAVNKCPFFGRWVPVLKLRHEVTALPHTMRLKIALCGSCRERFTLDTVMDMNRWDQTCAEITSRGQPAPVRDLTEWEWEIVTPALWATKKAP